MNRREQGLTGCAPHRQWPPASQRAAAPRSAAAAWLPRLCRRPRSAHQSMGPLNQHLSITFPLTYMFAMAARMPKVPESKGTRTRRTPSTRRPSTEGSHEKGPQPLHEDTRGLRTPPLMFHRLLLETCQVLCAPPHRMTAQASSSGALMTQLARGLTNERLFDDDCARFLACLDCLRRWSNRLEWSVIPVCA